MNGNYSMSAPVLKHIYSPPVNVNLPYNVSAYLDDTALFNGSVNEISRKLTTMASFYDFTNIQTNPRKAIMLTNDTESINE